ncbi:MULTISPECIES: TIGR04283 family arsenosugar biosynthesis glycosyltransferase [Flavobacteriaceae]|uniref:TIGR04283 family arsenosugar biosynthesis glycosyltransferase n=1 Tax=Flavobacteriaceae TaxID=49546 RepID=UPI0014919C16|nr:MULTISPECIES: TIGR04283 family arsenosugar biosynthesis glycosyltransferase [Allomuricauda]MDC6365547.1 TIGR04283 family arsenosugar biosynthesis glycosyltransferase [Muricauda sp. AC10]
MSQSNTPSISIIIPVLNEENYIGQLLHHLQQVSTTTNTIEIICVDGGSSDCTIEVSKNQGATVISSEMGRAKQMNLGAKHAHGDILYFLHADTYPPENFDQHIQKAVSKGHKSGCFRMKFDTGNPFLRFFAWFSRINHTLCRGGDQSLFIKRSTFEKNKGFNESYQIYEDTEFISRLYKQTTFKVLSQYVITSSRKYRQIGCAKLQFHFAMIHIKNYRGAGPEELYQYYSENIATH